MNKAFVREPEDDGRGYCPYCGSLGTPVEAGPLDTHIRPTSRGKLREAVWFCSFSRCEVAYFNQFDVVVLIGELKGPVYPKQLDSAICACFGFTYDDVEADVRDGQPKRIRELLAKSKTSEVRCRTLAADGRCCMSAVQELYMKLRSATDSAE